MSRPAGVSRHVHVGDGVVSMTGNGGGTGMLALLAHLVKGLHTDLLETVETTRLPLE